ncbi:flagellar hook-associated protein 3 [Pseudothauera nasutitermitis]|uniref:Flagellar hook-associated protein 3 n=1 Tax=Pseudothauera nasutitermitis TaxID=2565930 RepID=A0A4S4AZU2_9RHOO|nr:flagellar hook-associated protein FlgL [Pseudothauera nasutitermitis]THF65719.1 flagellar hook-associated protein 3 [Pseudothauera nasutitermitis]
MRISSNMIYQKGVGSMQQQWSSLLHTQQQLSTGRRVLTPADDPIAASRALELGQSKGVNSQFMVNTGYAEDRLGLLEGKLTGIGDILQYMRTKTVEAGNGSYDDKDLAYVATDLRAQFDAMLALANSQDGMGDYLFSGYMANQQPFSGDLAGVTYHGDHGTQTIQVSASRYMPVSLPGSDIFTNTRAYSNDLIAMPAGTNNVGNGALSAALPDPADPSLLGRRYEVTYHDDGVNPPTWDIYEYRPGVADKIPVAVGATALNDPAITAALGFELDLASGTPEDGDQFEVFASSPNIFDNLGMLIDAMERPGPAGMAAGAVAVGLENIDGALENVLKTRARIGSQLVETEALQSLGSDLNLQYEESISDLMDVDYVEALSRFAQQQTYLQAAQQSFMQVSRLSLFDYL